MARKDKPTGIDYVPRNTPIHRLGGSTKLLMVLLCSLATMLTFDTRFLVGMILGTLVMFRISKIKMRDVRVIFILLLGIMCVNCITIYLFAPEQGVLIYGTRHEIVRFTSRYALTQEQLFYELNITLKYLSIMPIALVFITTTEPSEFASSLNRLGVSYRVVYSVSLTLRYIPSVKRDWHEIRQAQQARGIDTTKKAKLPERVKNTAAVLFPLIFSSLASIDTISNAMELRGFGKKPKRTWLKARPMRGPDYAVIVCCALLLALSLTLNYLNGGRFYNPFV